MPSPYLKKLAKETGKSLSELEKLWDKAKDITSDTFGTSEGDFGQREYAYATATVKRMLGLDEELFNPATFLKSKKDAKGYIETLVSGEFDIGNVVPPDEDQEDDEEEDDYPIDEKRNVHPASSDTPYDGSGGKGSTEVEDKDIVEDDYDDFEEYSESMKKLDEALDDAL